MKNLGGEHPARTPVTDPFVQVLREAVKQAYGAEPLIVPTMAGTGPLYPFVVTLGLANADCGIGYPDASIHAPERKHPHRRLPQGDEGDRGVARGVRAS